MKGKITGSTEETEGRRVDSWGGSRFVREGQRSNAERDPRRELRERPPSTQSSFSAIKRLFWGRAQSASFASERALPSVPSVLLCALGASNASASSEPNAVVDQAFAFGEILVPDVAAVEDDRLA